ncbi:hypothetical protein OUZ56_022418 [Daphnia magna]|uniref:Uncharacterized protein n=1 Tax=Daphnia magna TaxID=35525 RepID=A0ABR0AWC2_9CRUS|nr:hypothetical protein OUZ56_022418 [Daphnia magna]
MVGVGKSGCQGKALPPGRNQVKQIDHIRKVIAARQINYQPKDGQILLIRTELQSSSSVLFLLLLLNNYYGPVLAETQTEQLNSLSIDRSRHTGMSPIKRKYLACDEKCTTKKSAR